MLVTIIWAALTAVGEILALKWDPLPMTAAIEGEVVDEAFHTLVFLAVPVFAFVVASLGYSLYRFRSNGKPAQDGSPFHTHGAVVGAWLVITTGLTVLLIVFPGATGLLELRGMEKNEDLRVQVEGMRYAWKMTYPEQRVISYQELVLPVGQRVRFDVSAADVLHSFWVPAFRVKVDAVPGMVTSTYATPNRTGTFEGESGFHVQCAELCGVGHSIMKVPVRVVEPSEFEAWIAKQARSS